MRFHRKLPQTEVEARAQTLQGQCEALGNAARDFGNALAVALRRPFRWVVRHPRLTVAGLALYLLAAILWEVFA